GWVGAGWLTGRALVAPQTLRSFKQSPTIRLLHFARLHRMRAGGLSPWHSWLTQLRISSLQAVAQGSAQAIGDQSASAVIARATVRFRMIPLPSSQPRFEATGPGGAPGAYRNDFPKVRAKRPWMAARPLSRRKRVPVPVKWGWVMTGACAGCHASPVHWNHSSWSWSNTCNRLLKNFAYSALTPVPPTTVPSGWIFPTRKMS